MREDQNPNWSKFGQRVNKPTQVKRGGKKYSFLGCKRSHVQIVSSRPFIPRENADLTPKSKRTRKPLKSLDYPDFAPFFRGALVQKLSTTRDTIGLVQWSGRDGVAPLSYRVSALPGGRFSRLTRSTIHILTQGDSWTFVT